MVKLYMDNSLITISVTDVLTEPDFQWRSGLNFQVFSPTSGVEFSDELTSC